MCQKWDSFTGSANECPKKQYIVEEHHLSFMTIAADDKIMFEDDNAPIHTAASTKIFF